MNVSKFLNGTPCTPFTGDVPPIERLIMPCIVDTLFLSCSTLLSVHQNITLSALMMMFLE